MVFVFGGFRTNWKKKQLTSFLGGWRRCCFLLWWENFCWQRNATIHLAHQNERHYALQHLKKLIKLFFFWNRPEITKHEIYPLHQNKEDNGESTKTDVRKQDESRKIVMAIVPFFHDPLARKPNSL